MEIIVLVLLVLLVGWLVLGGSSNSGPGDGTTEV